MHNDLEKARKLIKELEKLRIKKEKIQKKFLEKWNQLTPYQRMIYREAGIGVPKSVYGRYVKEVK